MHLDSHLFATGTKVKVTSKIRSNNYPPNSLIFVSTAFGNFRENPNITILNGTIIRKGKRGKNRLENATLTIPVFDIEREAKNLKRAEYRGYSFVHAVPLEIGGNVLDYGTMDFAGWARAFRFYLRNAYANMGIGERWPKRPGSLLNVINNNGVRIEDILEVYANADNRISFVNDIRKMEATIAPNAAATARSRSLAELKAAAYLVWDDMTNPGLYDKRLLYNNYLHYKRKYEEEIIKAASCSRKPHNANALTGLGVAGVRKLVRNFDKYKETKNRPPDFQTCVFDRDKKVVDIKVPGTQNVSLSNIENRNGGIVINEDYVTSSNDSSGSDNHDTYSTAYVTSGAFHHRYR